MKRLPGAGVAASLLATACTVAPAYLAPAPADLAYPDAVARIELRQQQDDSVAVANGRSIFMTRGERAPRVYVLLHGFTDAPTQFAAIGAHLFADGANVYIPRLPHHAERVAPLRAISQVRADELARFADSTAAIARGLGDTIVVVGLSAGGVLAGWIAQFHPEVQRAVLIAPAIAPGSISDDGGALVLLASKLPDVHRMSAPVDTTRPENVPGFTTRGLAELLRLGRQVRGAAGRTAPGAREIVMLLNEGDRTVSQDASLDLAQRWMDHGATVAAYRFDAASRLPHNVMELTSRGGNTDLVYPVVEALARGADAPDTVKRLAEPCGGFRCLLRHLTRAQPE